MGSKLVLVALGTAAIAGAILLALTNAAQIQAQSAPTASAPMPSFEVASVRRSGPREPTSFQILPNRLTIRNYLMLLVILFAYGRDFGDFGYRNLRGISLWGHPSGFGAENLDTKGTTLTRKWTTRVPKNSERSAPPLLSILADVPIASR